MVSGMRHSVCSVFVHKTNHSCAGVIFLLMFLLYLRWLQSICSSILLGSCQNCQLDIQCSMKELYREIKVNKPWLRFLPELSLSGLAEVVYFDLRLYFLHNHASHKGV